MNETRLGIFERMEVYKDLPLLRFAGKQEWLDWLDINHALFKGAWLMFAKKGSGTATITYEEAREGALIYGWIDGLKNGFNETHHLIRFTQRQQKGGWSKINRGIVERLIHEGRMHPAGLVHVEGAKQDGRWEAAYDSQATMIVPHDFRQALDQNPEAASVFETLKSANRYAFLSRLQTTRKQEARPAKIAKFIEMLAAGKSFHA